MFKYAVNDILSHISRSRVYAKKGDKVKVLQIQEHIVFCENKNVKFATIAGNLSDEYVAPEINQQATSPAVKKRRR